MFVRGIYFSLILAVFIKNCVETKKISGILRGPGGVQPNKYTQPPNGTDNESYQETALELSKNMTQMLQDLLRHYNNNQRPGHGGSPTVVTTNILIRSMGPISEQDMAYSMDCYFRQKWVDQRLQFEGQMDQLSLNIKMLELLWKPDTYFHNGKDSYLHTITRPNKLLRILKNGEILYSMRLTIKAKCPMKLENFPMDIQSCPLVFGSYGYPVDEMVYQWDPVGGVSLNEGQLMSQFDLIGFPFRNTTVTFRRGYFSALQVNFRLRRHTGYFLIQVYVPCILIVVLSWVSFWINREATADRVGLGITTVLTLSTFVLDTRTDLPKVSYPTALDWFVIMSFMFVISTLLEFAGVHYFTKIGSGEFPVPVSHAHKRRHHRADSQKDRTTTDESEDSAEEEEQEKWNIEDTPTRSAGESCTDDDKPIQLQQQPKPKKDFWGTVCCTGANQVSCSANSPFVDSSARVVLRRGSDACYPANITTTPSTPRVVRSSGQKVRKRRSRAYCCVQFVHCVAGSEKYRQEMRSRGDTTPGAINSVSKIDKFSRIFFPFIFIMLNIFYWFFYWRTPAYVNFPEN